MLEFPDFISRIRIPKSGGPIRRRGHNLLAIGAESRIGRIDHIILYLVLEYPYLLTRLCIPSSPRPIVAGGEN